MATNIEHGVNLLDDYTVRLVPGRSESDSVSMDLEESGTRSGYAKMDQHRSVSNENTRWATRRQLFYLLAAIVIIAFIAFINLIVSSVGIHKMHLIKVTGTSGPSEEFAGLVQELQENELDFLEDDSISTKATLESSEVEQNVVIKSNSTQPDVTTGFPPEHRNNELNMPERGNNSSNTTSGLSEVGHNHFKKDDCIFTWVEHIPGPPPVTKVTVGQSPFLVVRARKDGGFIPGEAGTFIQTARYAYKEADHKTNEYQILTAPPQCINWVKPTHPGEIPIHAVPGGTEPYTGITLYICTSFHQGMLFFGWIKESESQCSFAFRGETTASDYSILTSN